MKLYFFVIHKFIVSSVLAKLFGDKFGNGIGKDGDSLNGSNATNPATGRQLILIFQNTKNHCHIALRENWDYVCEYHSFQDFGLF